MIECCLMKIGNSISVRSSQSQMEAWTWRALPFRLKLNCKLVATSLWAVANRLISFARPQIIPDPHVSKWGENRIIKCSRTLNIRNP